MTAKFLAYAPEAEGSRNFQPHVGMLIGLRRHGLNVEERRIGEHPWEAADCIILNGWRKPGRAHTEIIDRQLAAGGRLLIMDAGYVLRKHYWSAGWDGLNGRADFRNAGSPPERWRQFARGLTVKPWRRKGKSVVLMGQVHNDAALGGLDIAQWLAETAAEVRRHTDRPILYRPHPRMKRESEVEGAQCVRGEIADVLDGAHAVVTYNSTSAVDSLLAGVPVFAADEGSIAWAVANKDLALIETPAMPSLTGWLSDLAYTQWTPAEMEAGLAWDHLRSGFQ